MTLDEIIQARALAKQQRIEVIEAIGNALTFLEHLGYRDGGDIHDDLQKAWETMSGKKWVVTQPQPSIMVEAPGVLPAHISRCPDCDVELRLVLTAQTQAVVTSGYAWFCPGCEARYTKTQS